MARSGSVRIAVRISEDVWAEEVERFNAKSPARIAAERERPRLLGSGIELAQLRACSGAGADGTNLDGLYKAYVPMNDDPPSTRPFALVFSPARRDNDVYLRLVSFGERHPRKGTRSVYQRAHKRLHGRYPGQ